MNPNVISVIMGGRGTRLNPLTKLRCKPAVPLAGKFRLVDIPISNCLNSGLNKIFVLTQFNTASLHRHIQESYSSTRSGAASSTSCRPSRRSAATPGTRGRRTRCGRTCTTSARADDLFLILSGDALYRMDLREIIQQHIQTKAELTIAACALPVGEVQGWA
jgi:glucose-1-phosphate adenylyltransferase